jgi:hypothetical protein
MDGEGPPLSYLLECSGLSLKRFKVANLNKSANIKKEVRKLLVEWAESEAMAIFAEWLEVYGPQLLALSTGELKPEVVELEKPKPLIERQTSFADWRSTRRHWRKRAG